MFKSDISMFVQVVAVSGDKEKQEAEEEHSEERTTSSLSSVAKSQQ